MRIQVKVSTLKEYTCYFFLMVLCLYRSNAVFGSFNRVLIIIDICAFLYASFLFVENRLYRDRRLWPMVIMLPWMILTTAFQGADTELCIQMCYKMFATIYLMAYVIRKNPIRAIKAMAKIWTVFLMIQVYSFVTHCFGTTVLNSVVNNYFLGIRVNIDQYIIYALFFNHLAAYYGGIKERLCFAISLICGVYFVVGEWVATSIIGLVIFYVIIIGSFFIKQGKIWKFMLSVVLCFSALFFTFQTTGIMNVIVESYLQKNVTLSGRTYLWEWVINNIEGIHWIVGYGDIEQMQIPLWHSSYTTHPHNNYLEFLYKYGAIGLLMYLNYFVNIISKVKELGSKKVNTYVVGATAASIVMSIVSKNYWFMTAQIFYIIVINLGEIDEYSKNLCNVEL